MRISQTDEKFDKVELQEKRLRKLAKDNGYTVVDAFSDDGVSGWSGKTRHGWLKLIDGVKAKDFDIVLATAEDRFTRNSEEKMGFQVECAKAGVKWHTLGGGQLDPSNAPGGLMGTISGAIAQYESTVKSDRLKARFEDETMNGKPLWGTRPFGYARNRIDLEPEEAAELAWAYLTIQDGGSVYSIIKKWNQEGVLTTQGNPWSWATVQQMLKRPRNAGLVVRQGVIQEGITAVWEAVVTREDWEATCAILSDPKRRTAAGRKQSHLAAGLITCGVCGSVMRSARANLKGVSVPIYRCATKMNVQSDGRRHPTVQTDILDPLITEAIVAAFIFGPTNLIADHKAVPTDDLQAKLSKVRGARQRVVSLVVDDHISQGEAAKQLDSLKKQEMGLEGELAEIRRTSAQGAMALGLKASLFTGKRVDFAKAVDAKKALRERFTSLPLIHQRELLKNLLSVTVDVGRSRDRIQITHLRATSLNEVPEAQ
ncbi:recombinase family protein [Cryobacterium sp. TMT2-4]|uniref:recombinase family protein n=1 Tax=Cryobacterium sp. TMT2-4 TaxID=1259254 RepID=UPI00141BE029|nr:recombinase family protein [Cryobacterium sp. TMT2-4]